ncbi:MAG TPA: choice-of-anchor R domain-containing protein [Opitutus sp.]|nr:choice-of-anchor R domain-containing protein [Opitutus sp.]
MKMPRAAALGLLLVLGLALSAARAQTVYFGNFAPGTDIDTTNPYGFAGVASQSGSIYAAASVSFTTGSVPLQITGVDLALGSPQSGSVMHLAITTSDLPSPGTPLQTFSTVDTIPGTPAVPARITFTPDSDFTLEPDTTYYLQLEVTQTPGHDVDWFPVLDGGSILSDYSTYNYGYSSGSTYTAQDLGGYYITATSAVPEAATTALLVGGAALCLGLVRRVRSRRDRDAA